MTLAQLYAFARSPIGAWLLVYALLLVWNQITREGSAVDRWTATRAPRLHGSLLLVRGVAGYGPQISLGVFKLLAGAAVPPAWLVALLPIAPPPVSPLPPPLPERRA
jgi:hypothetical protein